MKNIQIVIIGITKLDHNFDSTSTLVSNRTYFIPRVAKNHIKVVIRKRQFDTAN